MKYLKTLALLAFVLTKSLYSFDDDPAPAAEIFIANRSTTKDIFIKVIPVGFVFNGKTTSEIKDFRYSSEASKPFDGKENHIFGGFRKLPKVTEFFSWEINGFTLNHDFWWAQGSRCDSIFGYGKYIVEFWNLREDSDEPESVVDYCYIDFSDWDYPYQHNNDVYFNYYSDNNITFNFAGQEIQIEDPVANRELKIWYQIESITPTLVVWSKTQNKGNFKTTTETNYNSYLYFPIKASEVTSIL